MNHLMITIGAMILSQTETAARVPILFICRKNFVEGIAEGNISRDSKRNLEMQRNFK